ncbi:hypothetical protein B0J11DRAFT_613754 [Dendryphion nanum]|uniref:Uncharacterized protein n=1 Tax=Dendryphion nanum TaxID=256645 RepID=A0A9P9IQ92_9PLEO|nr:hypothetical protein B0J11DRAFT_613754 [Dendryphion nanum]
MNTTLTCQSCAIPDWRDFQRIPNCKVAAKFLAPYITTRTINTDDLLAFLRTLKPTIDELGALSWFACTKACRHNSAAMAWLFVEPENDCLQEMMIVYCLQLLFCLLFIFFFFYSRRAISFAPGIENAEKSIKERIRSAFESSFPEFHNAATIFTFTVVVANLVLHIPSTGSHYTNSLSFIISIFTISIYFATLPLALAIGRRRKFRKFLAVLIALLGCSVVWLNRRTKTPQKNEDKWEQLCYKEYSSSKYITAIIAIYFAGAGGTVLYILGKAMLDLLHKEAKDILGLRLLVRVPARFVLVCYCCCVAIVTLAFFFEHHASLRKVAGADGEQQWGFGQVLALATWVPVLIQFVYTLVEKQAETLRSALPRTHDAVRIRSSEANVGDMAMQWLVNTNEDETK